MSTTVLPAAARTSPDFLTFLKLELAPSPARWQATLRLTLACLVATIPIMVLHLHEQLLVVLFIYVLAKEDSTASAIGTLVAMIGFTIGLGLLLLYFMTVLDIVWLRVCLIPIVVAGTLYLNRIIALGPLGTTIGLPLAVGMGIPDTLHSPELLGRVPFWIWWAVGLGLLTNLGVQLVLNPADPRDTLARALAQRLAAIDAAIARALAGEPSLETGPARVLAVSGLDGQLKLLKLAMLKHRELRRYRSELSALAALVNRLVVAAATLETLLPLEITDADRARFVNVASACAAAREAVANLRWPDAATALQAASAVNIPTAIAPLAEMEHLLALLPLSLPGGAGAPTEVAPHAVHTGFFVPDALTNPEYRHFAIKGALPRGGRAAKNHLC